MAGTASPSHKLEKLQASITRLYQAFRDAGDTIAMGKLKDLGAKVARGDYGIAFCGHFSAGKSRMINSLIGAMLLPSSPIPTSANLVRIVRGEDFAEVHFHDGLPRRYLAPYDYDLVKSYAKDGDSIESITLSSNALDIPEGVTFMDTPGIDSTDPAHRKATEAAIHLADLICYVMDYNHVQAEESFRFTKALTDAGKRVLLIINQVDKHEESELSFADFHVGLEQAFSAWGVESAGIFFTSMKDANHPQNEFPELSFYLHEAMKEKETLLEESILASLRGIIEEARAREIETAKPTLETAEKVLEHLNQEECDALYAGGKALQRERESLETDLKSAFTERFETILANAYMMPYETRELARVYLEAADPKFKIGFFSRGKKTEAELSRRREMLWTAYMEKVDSQLNWHIRSFLKDFARTYSMDMTSLGEEVDQFTALPEDSVLETMQKEGADVKDGSYLLGYTASLETAAKQTARERVVELRDSLFRDIEQKRERRREQIEKELSAMRRELNAIGEIRRTHKAIDKRHSLRMDLLDSDEISPIDDTLFTLPREDFEVIAGDTTITSQKDKEETGTSAKPDNETTQSELKEIGETDTASPVEDSRTPKSTALEDAAFAAWIPRLRRASSAMEGLLPLERLSKELATRADRLEQRRFLVALFGAFSAGKSSFANALLGDALLPVSPNPTTAAINKILPADEEHPEHTVIVKLKTASMLLADLNRALAAYEKKAKSLDEVRELATKLTEGESASAHASFLRAYLKGRELLEERLGTSLTLTLEDFPAYAAEEQKSCFVEEIDVYVDTPLTRRGIVLVDTPGADSVNARHTEAAFRFIKESDAILFVTYYNHAFSQADSDFLRQLGRVKDAFSMDKMFFLVNAIDLAESEEEGEEVVSYVRKNLLRFGVAKPRLFALSSKELLEERCRGRYRETEFETAFYDFIFHELRGLVLKSVEGEYARARALIEELIEESTSGEEKKAARLASLEQEERAIERLLAPKGAESLLRALEAEQRELLYYVAQRVFFRFDDMYKLAFNPASLGQGTGKKELEKALEELLHHLGFTLAEEMRALTLRLEHFLSKRVRDFLSDMEHEVSHTTKDFYMGSFEAKFSGDLTFIPAFETVERRDFERDLAMYKNPSQFFEQGGSKELEKVLEEKLKTLANAYLDEEGKRISSRFEEGAQTLFDAGCKHMGDALTVHFATHRAILTDGVPVEKLEELKKYFLPQV